MSVLPKQVRKARKIKKDVKEAQTSVSPLAVPSEWTGENGDKGNWHKGSVPREKLRELANEGLKPETLQQRKAYECYLDMGSNRSLPKVAEHFGKASQVIYRWSKKFGWVDRVARWEIENQGNLTIESFSEQRKKKKFLLDLVDTAIKDSVVLNKDGTIKETLIKLKSASDVRTFVSLRQEILDEGKVKLPQTPVGTQNIQNAVFIIRK